MNKNLIKMTAFTDELNTKLMEKDAGIGTFFKTMFTKLVEGPKQFTNGITNSTKLFGQVQDAVASTVVLGGAMAVANALYEGVKAIEGKYQDFKLEQDKIPAFNAVLAHYPELREHPKAPLYFDVLWHFAPSMAENPLSAGAYIKQAMAMDHVYGGPIPASIGEITKIQKDIADANNKDKGDGSLATIMMPLRNMNGFNTSGKDKD